MIKSEFNQDYVFFVSKDLHFIWALLHKAILYSIIMLSIFNFSFFDNALEFFGSSNKWFLSP